MPYSLTTLAAARAALAGRLNDSTNIHWSASELTRYIQEAIRTWSALTACFRDTCVIPTVPGECFYDVARDAPALCGYTVTDQQAISLLEYHLLEAQGLTLWNGTTQFTLSDLTEALQRRRDQFLRETGIVQARATQNVSPPNDGRIHLQQPWVEIRRMAWRSVEGQIRPLLRDDEWALSNYRRQWVQQPRRPPAVYSVAVTPVLTVQLGPGPMDSGTVDIVGVRRGATLNPMVGTGVLLGIPDDWTWVVVFGALADLLKLDGLPNDPVRADYCEQRWRQGLTLAQVAPIILTGRVDNKVLQMRSLADADRYARAWQSRTPWEPDALLLTNSTLFAVTPPPAAADIIIGGQYGITLDVVRKAPIPAVDTDYLQTSPEVLDSILDYGQHLAMFKDGPGSLQDSQALVERFFRAAGVQLELQQAMIPARGPLQQQNVQDQRVVPHVSPPEPTVVAGVEMS